MTDPIERIGGKEGQPPAFDIEAHMRPIREFTCGPSMIRYPEPPTDWDRLIREAGERRLLEPIAKVYGGQP